MFNARHTLTLVLLAASYCLADAPSVSYIFPAGGQRGTTVKFHVGGHYLHDKCPFEMLGPGVVAQPELIRARSTKWFEGPRIPMPASQRKEDYPWEQNGQVSIAANAELGFRRWRVWTSQGVVPTSKFVIGDLPEIIEHEIDGDPIPVAVQLPVTINGRMFPREDVDIWTFDARAGQSYTCEVMASRLGSPLDSRLVVRGPDGRRVAENIDTFGSDSFLRFVAPTDGTYQVHIHDVNFDGLQHFVYRLTITDGPHVDSVFPLGGRRGSSVPVKLTGQGVPSEPLLLSLPHSAGDKYRDQLALTTGRTNTFTMQLSDLPEVVESEPNDDSPSAQLLVVPTVANGRIQAAGDRDVWQLDASKDDELTLEVHASRLRSRLDSVLTIVDAEGKELASNDDLGKGDSDSRLTFKVPADGSYFVRVEEQFASRGGPSFAYRLHVERKAEPQPDFELTLASDALTVNRKAEAKIKVSVVRKDGFKGPIKLSVDNLPDGVTLTGDTIPANKNDVQLGFKAADKIKVQVHRVTIKGTAQHEEQEITRTATCRHDDIELEQLSLAVAIPTPYKVVGEFQTQYAAQGATFFRHFKLERDGYDGPVTVRPSERQVRHLQGVTGPTIDVPPGATAFDYHIKLAPWMEVGRTSRTAVMAVAEIVDFDGSKHTVSYTSHGQNDQVIILCDPGQLDIAAETTSLTAIPNKSRDVPVRVNRGQGIKGPVRLELITPEHIQGVAATPITVPADQASATLRLRFASNGLGPFNMPLTIRATAMVDGHPYTAEEKVAVVANLPVAGTAE